MMKKLIAIVLALLMLLASTALAERANVMIFSKPCLELTQDGKDRTIDLSSLKLQLAAGEPGGVPSVQLDVTKNGKNVERAKLQVIDNTLYFQADGISYTLALDLSAGGGRARALVDAAFADVDYLMDFKLPAIGGRAIPRIDMQPLAALTLSPVKTDEKGHGSADISIPYAMTKQLMGAAAGYRDSVPAAVKPYTDMLFNLVDQMLETDSGFALKGRIGIGKKKSSLTLDVYPVTGGVTADAPAAKVKLASLENRLDLTVDMYQGDATVNAAAFSLTSEPRTAEMSFAMDVMSVITANGSVSNVDGVQQIALEINSLGKHIAASGSYGTIGDADTINFSLALPNLVNVSGSLQAREDGAGASSGTATVSGVIYADEPATFTLTGDVYEGYEDVEFRAVKKTGDAIDVTRMTDSQREQLGKDVDRLVKKLLKGARIG